MRKTAADKPDVSGGGPLVGLANTFAICQRELKAYFLSPIAYVVMVVFLVPQNSYFLGLLDYLCSRNTPGTESPMAEVLGSNPFVWLILFATIPAITMKLFAEEKRSGTIEMLMTAPVTDVQVVMGKYLASLALYVIMWIPTLSYVVVVCAFGDPDVLKIVAGYLGVLLAGAMFLGFGVLASSVTRNQVIAYVLGMSMCIGVIFMNLFIGIVPGMHQIPAMKGVMGYVDVIDHMSSGFSRGIVDTRPVIYYMSLLAFSLFVTVQVVQSRKWKS